MVFDPTLLGYPLNSNFSRDQLCVLVRQFRGATTRTKDESLAVHLEEDLLLREPPSIKGDTFRRLAKWCKTDGHPYQDGMDVARRISVVLFGQILDRDRLGV
jgi:hypothetical protein